MSKMFYGLYDLANSAYTMIIITFVTSAYFANQIVGNPQLGAAYWQWTAGLCGITIALTGPFIGAWADKKPKGKINFLQIFTLLCILTTCLFWFAKPNSNYILFTLIIFFISNYCYELGTIFYNSLLKKCSDENNIGKTSGFAFALGYIGSVPILLLTLYFFILPETIPFGLDKNNFEHIRFIPLIVALWFFIFSLPMISYFKKKISYEENNDLTPVSKKIFEIIWKNKFTSAGKFLLARMIYSDALIVLIAGGGVYASGVFNFNSSDLLKLAIAGNIVAFVGVLIGGHLNDKFSSKAIILFCIAVLTGTVIYGSLIAQTKSEFFYNVMVISFFIGSIQSASRVMMTKLLNKTDLGKGFGLFSFSGRVTAFAGPLMVGTLTYLYSQRIGFLSVSFFFVLGFLLMISVKNV
jgi:UMF1 family MFS transporter